MEWLTGAFKQNKDIILKIFFLFHIQKKPNYIVLNGIKSKLAVCSQWNVGIMSLFEPVCSHICDITGNGAIYSL